MTRDQQDEEQDFEDHDDDYNANNHDSVVITGCTVGSAAAPTFRESSNVEV
jgi:hypothetical protein